MVLALLKIDHLNVREQVVSSNSEDIWNLKVPYSVR